MDQSIAAKQTRLADALAIPDVGRYARKPGATPADERALIGLGLAIRAIDGEPGLKGVAAFFEKAV